MTTTITETVDERQRADAIEARLEEVREEIEETRRRRARAEQHRKETEEAAAEARALAPLGEASEEEAESLRGEYEECCAELEALKEKEADLLRTESVLEERLEEAETEALWAEAEVIKEGMASHVEEASRLAGKLVRALQRVEEANKAYNQKAFAASGGKASARMYLYRQGFLNQHRLKTWREYAARDGFDVDATD